MAESDLIATKNVGVGNVLKSLRLIRDFTIKDLAERMGVSAGYISEVETNKKKPSLDMISKYGEALGVQPQTIVFFNEEGKKSNYNTQKLLLNILQEIAKVEG